MRNQTQLNHLAREAYTAYAEHQKWRSYDGTTLPQWDDVRDDIQYGWEAAVSRVMELTS